MESPGGDGSKAGDGGFGNCRGRFNLCVCFLLGGRSDGVATTFWFSSRIKNRFALQVVRGIFPWLAPGQKTTLKISGVRAVAATDCYVTVLLQSDEAGKCGRAVCRFSPRKAAPLFHESVSGHDAKAFQQLLAHFHGDLRRQPAQHFLAKLGVHRCEGPDKIVATLHFDIATPTNAERQQRGRSPNQQVTLLDHASW